MRAYSNSGPTNAGATANKTMVIVGSNTSARPAIYDVTIGCGATPADYAAVHLVQRATALGTSTSQTPLPLDASQQAATSTGGITASAEPTYTAAGILLQVALHQRATFRWVAMPGYELVTTAGAATGTGLNMLSSTTSQIYYGQVFFFE